MNETEYGGAKWCSAWRRAWLAIAVQRVLAGAEGPLLMETDMSERVLLHGCLRSGQFRDEAGFIHEDWCHDDDDAAWDCSCGARQLSRGVFAGEPAAEPPAEPAAEPATCALLGCRRRAFGGARCPQHGGPPDPAEALCRQLVMAGELSAGEVATEAIRRYPGTGLGVYELGWLKTRLRKEAAAARRRGEDAPDPPPWPKRAPGTAHLVEDAGLEADLGALRRAAAEFSCALHVDDASAVAGLAQKRGRVAAALGLRRGLLAAGPDAGYVSVPLLGFEEALRRGLVTAGKLAERGREPQGPPVARLRLGQCRTMDLYQEDLR